MMTKDDLVHNFADVADLGGGLFRASLVFPKKSFYYYFGLASLRGDRRDDSLVISENAIDDEFARLVLSDMPSPSGPALNKAPLGDNRYKFTHRLAVPSSHHSELKGLLDAKRAGIVLCVPIHKPEFSGRESVEEFTTLRREVVATMIWNRPVTPKIAMRFDNSKTGAGTDNYVLTKFDLVKREIENLAGVTDGFVEIMNYADAVREIVSDSAQGYVWISDRDDATRKAMGQDELLRAVWSFLTA